MISFPIQNIEIPLNCALVKHDFTTYNPSIEYSESDSLNLLKEDLFQVKFVDLDLIIDLGWYGNFETNEGLFMIMVVQNQDWDNPLKTTRSVSQLEITEKLQSLLKFYGSK